MRLSRSLAPSPVTGSTYGESVTHLQGRLLLCARVLWVALVLVTEGIFFASLPAYFMLLQTICRNDACAYGQISSQAAQTLQQLSISPTIYATVNLVFMIVVAVFCLITCCIIFWRRSNDWMALLVSYIFSIGSTTCVTITLSTAHSSWTRPNQYLGVLIFIVFYIGFCLFPNGRFVPPWSRRIAFIYVVFILVASSFFPNPLILPISLRISIALCLFTLFVFLVGFQLYRYRYVSNSVQRQQSKWVLYGFSATMFVIVIGALPVYIWPGSLYNVLFSFVYACVIVLIPLTMAVAIFRYRLWDIDVLIKLTLIYSILTAVLVLVYTSLILLLEGIWRSLFGQGDTISIIISTLIIAALFQPLRFSIQLSIDRRFYRRKQNTQLLLEAFSANLRNELNLEQISERLASAAEETMQPTHVSLWLRKRQDGEK